MLITSVLHILDLRQLGTKTPGGISRERVESSSLEQGSAPNGSVEEPGKKDKEEPVLLRPLLPSEHPFPTLLSQRGFDEFLKAMEELKKEGKIPKVDLFE